MDRNYVKMSELVDQEFTVSAVKGYKYVAWDNEEHRYVTEDSWFKGSTKKYTVETNKGTLDIGANHVGAMLEGVQHAGKADIIGATFSLKSNGKEGKDIRYFVNAVRTPSASREDEEPISLDDIPL